ncbi:OLC1v1025558C1 [Oldenlandia corymbosa var. corymbosa]|uniref:OLC1v1025558C1 n=1 Tax=Oldenlandia corymbosa var. corymbosa TaxID=529605 RepID=A0AAV1C508_OLDCO|nr:OLC1v1025558C1 [Oldenlandia corymbosa var. corymbosa]
MASHRQDLWGRMEKYQGWFDFAFGTERSREVMRDEKDYWKLIWSLDVVFEERMDSVMAELDFLCLLLKAFDDVEEDTGSSPYSVDAGSSKFFFIRVGVAAEKLEKHLRRDFYERFNGYSGLKTQLVRWMRNAMQPFQSKLSKLLEVFITLDRKCGDLKLDIRQAYRQQGERSLTTLSFQPISSFGWGTMYWRLFCHCLDRCLLCMSSNERYFHLLGDDQLRKQMITLRRRLHSINWILTYDDCQDEDFRADYGGIFMQVARLCCLCWYGDALAMDESMKQRLAISLSDLNSRMDLDASQFLDVMVKCLGCDPGESSYLEFIGHVLDNCSLESDLVSEFASLFKCVTRLREMHDDKDTVDVPWLLGAFKDLLLETIYLNLDADQESNVRPPDTILFAKLWSLKVEILIMNKGTLLTLSDVDLRDHKYERDDFAMETIQIGDAIVTFPKQLQDPSQSSSSPEGDNTEYIKVGNMLYKSFVLILLFKAKTTITKLLEDITLAFPLRHKVAFLGDGLGFLMDLVAKKPKEDKNLILKDVEVMATEVLTLSSSHLPNNLEEEQCNYLEVCLLDLTEKAQHLIAKVIENFQIPKFHLPKTPGFFFIEGHLQKLGKRLSPKHKSSIYVTYRIEAISKALERIVNNSQDAFCKEKYHYLHSQVVDVAYKAERLFDLMLGEIKVPNHFLWLCHLLEEIRHIEMQLANLDENNSPNGDGVHNVTDSLKPKVSMVSTAGVDEFMVVHKNQKKLIIDRLIGDLATLLYKRLKKNRYLIVLDDMWSIRAWDDMKLSFPDDLNGSRILITSRLEKELSKISNSHCLHPLSEEESWELLKFKIFGKGDCPKELLEVGKQIAKNCKGLPLSIGAIGGVLDRTNKNEILWRQIAESGKEEKFSHQISDKDEPYCSLNNFDYGVHYEHFSESNSITHEQYRLFFHVNREQFVVSRPSGPFVRTLLLSATTDESPRCSYHIDFIPNNFIRLRVLDLESINMGNSWASGIQFLADLRYLAVCGDMESIPPSLSDLENLESFFLKSLKTKVFLPDTIWKMKKLRHLHVTAHAIFPLLNSFHQLDSLITLSLMYFSLGEEANNIMMRFPNLQKLKCICSEPTSVSRNSHLVPSWASLGKLESLSISYLGKVINGRELNLPSNLRKLSLSKFHLCTDHLSAIGNLQKLEGLKLISCAVEGSTWKMSQGKFLQLKYLELDNLNVVDWNACEDHLPRLQQLVLRNCKQLKEVPFDIGSISTLEKIEVQLCGSSVNESIRKIEEEEIEGLKIVINSSEKA